MQPYGRTAVRLSAVLYPEIPLIWQRRKHGNKALFNMKVPLAFQLNQELPQLCRTALYFHQHTAVMKVLYPSREIQVSGKILCSIPESYMLYPAKALNAPSFLCHA